MYKVLERSVTRFNVQVSTSTSPVLCANFLIWTVFGTSEHAQCPPDCESRTHLKTAYWYYFSRTRPPPPKQKTDKAVTKATLRLFISENQLHFSTTLLFYQHPSTRLFTMAHHTDGCRVDGHSCCFLVMSFHSLTSIAACEAAARCALRALRDWFNFWGSAGHARLCTFTRCSSSSRLSTLV